MRDASRKGGGLRYPRGMKTLWRLARLGFFLGLGAAGALIAACGDSSTTTVDARPADARPADASPTDARPADASPADAGPGLDATTDALPSLDGSNIDVPCE